MKKTASDSGIIFEYEGDDGQSIYNDFEDLLDNDEISAEEAGFVSGYVDLK